jgi:hypothetical protein
MIPNYIVVKDGVVIRHTPEHFERGTGAAAATALLQPDHTKGEYLFTAGALNPTEPTEFIDWTI